MNKTIIRLLSVFLVIAPAISSAMFDSHLPLTKQEMGKPFLLHEKKNIDISESTSFSLAAGLFGVRFTTDDPQSNLIANGKDKNGLNWRVVISEGFRVVDFYTADLDKNGITDVVILMPTGGNGLAPTEHIFTLMFDERGRPIPFEAEGYFESLPNGIDSLVDMNGDGRAELIYMNFNDGYWITNIYTCLNGRWSRVQGAFGQRKYPLFTRFTNRPNKKPATPKPSRHPFAPQLSNDKPLLSGFVTTFRIPDAYSDIELTIENSTGEHLECTPAYWYDSARVILDTSSGRQIAHLAHSDKEHAAEVLKTIKDRRIKVSLYGQRYSGRCSPEIVWATEEKY